MQRRLNLLPFKWQTYATTRTRILAASALFVEKKRRLHLRFLQMQQQEHAQKPVWHWLNGYNEAAHTAYFTCSRACVSAMPVYLPFGCNVYMKWYRLTGIFKRHYSNVEDNRTVSTKLNSSKMEKIYFIDIRALLIKPQHIGPNVWLWLLVRNCFI